MSERASESIADDLTTRYIVETQHLVLKQIDDYLRTAILASDLTAARIVRRELDPSDLQSWLAPCLDRLTSMPNIASITFGDTEGRTFWVIRTPNGYECALRVDPGVGDLREYNVDPETAELNGLLRTTEFDALNRPWYRAGTESEGPTWSEVYTWVGGDNQEYAIGASYARKVTGPSGQPIGVLSVDVTLGALSDFLSDVPIAQTGTLLLAEADGALLAASDAPVLGPDGGRNTTESGLRAIDSSLVRDDAGSPRGGRHAGTLRGAAATFASTPMSAAGFTDLTLYIGIPDQYLFADVVRTRIRLLGAGVAVIVIVGALSIMLSSGLTRRLRAVSTHVRSVSEGDFESRLDDSGPSEWKVLARDLNQMAEDLTTYVETQKGLEVAMEVQQALLPENAPDPEGLEIAGHSKYCDETGGDYYDFLERAHAGTTGQLVAVGDVMGHGVAAALLMATARAALRAHAPTAGSLGRLMTRVNDVLAADARHGRFMTLSILVFDPSDQSIRWASAGHDPALVIDPETGDVFELEGGDVPLGLVEDVEYEEFTRTNLPPGALVLVGTDGIWEMANDAGEMYGKERLFRVLRTHRTEPLSSIVEAIDRDLSAFRDGADVKDDVTFVIARFSA
jgi:sigma-B regulation protein RsbU (phosphoserine phosphatase)